MINVGLIGFGLSGRYLQAPFFMTNGAYCLKAVVTTQEISDDRFSKVKREANLDVLLADSAISLISICSPNATHFELAKRSLLAGKHVLVEKPMTATVAEAQELISIATEKGLTICCFQNRRYDGDFLTIQKLIASDSLGEILSYEASFDRNRPALNVKAWKEAKVPGSGILYDLGSHLIDQAICLFGNPLNFEGEVYTERPGSQIDDAFNLKLNYGALKVVLRASMMAEKSGPRYRIHGSRGSFVKHGIDVQEDQLRAGSWPGTEGFGKESEEFYGILSTELKNHQINENIETVPGNWMKLFDNLAATIKGQKNLLQNPSDIITQLEIIECIKNR